jgi:hypothetical protein
MIRPDDRVGISSIKTFVSHLGNSFGVAVGLKCSAESQARKRRSVPIHYVGVGERGNWELFINCETF